MRVASRVMRQRRSAAAVFCVTISFLLLVGQASASRTLSGRFGGVLNVGLGGEPITLDPTLNRLTYGNAVLAAICDGLYRTNAVNALVPDLATALPTISADKLTYTVPLRQGVTFNDGTPFTAQAVVETFQRDQTLPGSSQAGSLASIAGVTASGPYTVVFHLSSRYAPLPYVLGVPIMSPAQLTKLGTSFGTDPVGVGPYMFDSWSPGSTITVIKSPYYFDRYDVHFDKIVFDFLSDPAAAAAALQAGDIQDLAGVGGPEVASLQKAAGVRVIETPGFATSTILFINMGDIDGEGKLPYAANVGTPLSTSPTLRQAFEEALNRTTFNTVVLAGLAVPGCTVVSPADKPWYAGTNVPCTPYDPAGAKKLVAASGIASPTVTLMSGNDSTSVLADQFIQSAEAAVGIHVVIDDIDYATSQADVYAGKFDAYLENVGVGIDPSTTLYARWSTTGTSNFTGYSNPRLDLVLANSFKATSMTARLKLIRVAQQIILGDRPMIIFGHSTVIDGLSTTVQLGNHTFNDYLFGQYR
jgi:peptide/nickel transport system substrate-binding protein